MAYHNKHISTKNYKKKKKAIEFIYFDLGGVFFHFTAGLKKIAELSDSSYKQVKATLKENDDKACRGEISLQELWGLFQDKLNYKDELDFFQFWLNNFVVIPGTQQLATDLLKKYRIGLLTNIYKGVFAKILKAGFVPNISYSAIIKSCDIGLVKPEIEIYHYAQKQAGVSASKILFIDNKKENIKAAEKLGWNVFLFNETYPSKSVKKLRKLLL